jgi:hypothetical protein
MAFASASKVYRDNFLEYRTTGDIKYKTASDGAMSTIQGVIQKMQDQVNAVPVDSHTLRELTLKKQTLEENLFREKDRLKEAEMRGAPSGQAAVPSASWKYYTILGLIGGLVMTQFV